ncbi:MAG TPA: hypothetical protein VMR06_04100 [Dokdonella sp.]|uniref:hypothetical protein n=1 Tax=Dokdonella sp. TaxID=2291710 RepID=UPI002CAE759E|nr:hypothetical protein [Dokdonella sp.]HUD41160.1 hypothetical protein [Dokdonella sp.]
MKVFELAPFLALVCGLALSCPVSAGRTIGIFLCPSCGVATPIPDPQTNNSLISNQENWDAVYPDLPVSPGDILIICNNSYCVPYTMNANGTYAGGTRVPQLPPAGGTGSGSGGSGPPSGGLAGRLRCGYVNGVLDHCQYVYEYIA